MLGPVARVLVLWAGPGQAPGRELGFSELTSCPCCWKGL